MHQLTALPRPFGKLLATLGHQIDRSLPGRYRGRIARFLGPQPGRYVSPDLGSREALLAALTQRNIRYAVIGDQASGIPGADRLALMIDDDHVPAARRMVSPWPAGEAIEAYSPSGLPGFAFGDMPLMPPRLARRLLDGAKPVDGINTVDPRDRFFATLFRLVYLQGLQSGIPDADVPTTTPSPVVSALASQAAQVGVALEQPITLESLDTLLAAHDWQPPLDMLERIGCWNPWVAEKLRKAGEWVGSEPPGLTVFYLRQRTIDEGKTDIVVDMLRASGFRLLALPALTPHQLDEVTAEVRGGNWGRGPFPLSGGNPGAVLVAYDPAPIAPDADALRQFPLLDNDRIQRAKQAVRDAVHAGLPRNQRYNAMHSTDNAVQAWRAVRELYPDLEPELRASANGN